MKNGSLFLHSESQELIQPKAPTKAQALMVQVLMVQPLEEQRNLPENYLGSNVIPLGTPLLLQTTGCLPSQAQQKTEVYFKKKKELMMHVF